MMDNFDGYTSHKYTATPTAWHDKKIIELQAKVAALEADAKRYRWLKSKAFNETASDRYRGYHWSIGFYDPKCKGFDSAIDAAMESEG